MEADFWHDMWESGEVGFHQKEINAFLHKHWENLNLQSTETVLVPLCGKTLDMLWLADLGHEVLGVELSEKALQEFLTENNLTGAPVQHAHYCGYELEKITLLCGDFFKLSAEDAKDVVAIYDRAALIALPPEMRVAYAKHITELLPEGGQILQVIMTYDQSTMSGPPFSVTEEELNALYAENFEITPLETFSFSRKGHEAEEKVFKLRKKSG